MAGTATLVPGEPALTILDTAISLAPSSSHLVLGTATQALSPSTPSPVAILTINGQTITANSATQFIVSSQTLAAGGFITVSGTPITLGIVDGTSTLPLGSVGLAAAAFTFDGQVYTENSASEFAIGIATITPGAPAITVSGMPISVASGASDVVVGTSTLGLGGVIMGGFGGGLSNGSDISPFLGSGSRMGMGIGSMSHLIIMISCVLGLWGG